MKKILIAFFLIVSSVQAKEIQVKVNGMVCSMCAQGIEKKFSKESSVEKILVDLDEKKVIIKLKESGPEITDEKIIKNINEAGYNVAEIKRQ